MWCLCSSAASAGGWVGVGGALWTEMYAKAIWGSLPQKGRPVAEHGIEMAALPLHCLTRRKMATQRVPQRSQRVDAPLISDTGSRSELWRAAWHRLGALDNSAFLKRGDISGSRCSVNQILLNARQLQTRRQRRPPRKDEFPGREHAVY